MRRCVAVAAIQMVEDGAYYGASALIEGQQEMRIADNPQKATLRLLQEFPHLLELKDPGSLVAKSEPKAVEGDGWQYVVNVTADEQLRIDRLSEREREVVALLAEGLCNQKIAERLGLSVITVRHHLSSIFTKLQVNDRFECAIFALSKGMVKPFWLNASAFVRVVAMQ